MVVTDSEVKTKALSKIVLQRLIETGTNFLFLKGELGVGKTVLVKGIACELGIKEQILSPTFVLLREHKIQNETYPFSKMYHFDLYRLKNLEEVLELGIMDFAKDKKNLIVVEWPELLMEEECNLQYLLVEFKSLGEDKREIELSTNI